MLGSVGDVFAGIWRLVDPKITLASMASVFVGACASAHDGRVYWGWLALTVLGIFFVEGGKNASGELFDFDSGADTGVAPEDRTPFSGGKRVLVDGLLTRRQTAVLAAAGFLAGAVIGVLITVLREPRVLWLGVGGVACAWFYQAPPLKLSYRGLGEIAVGVCYGPLVSSGTYLVQRGKVPASLVLLTLPLGLAIMSFLWINELPDERADRSAGKRTLVVRLGRHVAGRAFAAMVIATYVLLAVMAGAVGSPFVLLGAVGLVPAAIAARRVLSDPVRTAAIIPAQGLTLGAFLVLALGIGIGLLLA
jgi:1,4-dihydroxy-2-naphthoate octaprenyltransferase